MKLLLDSHVLLWWTGSVSDRISDQLKHAIVSADSIAISAATTWGLEIKRSVGKLSLAHDIWERVSDIGIACLPITQEDAVTAGRLPLTHRDPFDRMIIAQALRRNLTLVTADADMVLYDVAHVRI